MPTPTCWATRAPRRGFFGAGKTTLLNHVLHKAVAALAAEGRFHYVLIEATGIAEPLPIAATFGFVDEQGRTSPRAVSLATSTGCPRRAPDQLLMRTPEERLGWGAEGIRD